MNAVTTTVKQNPGKVSVASIAAALVVASGLGEKWEGDRYIAYDDFQPNKVLKLGDVIKGTLTICRGHTGKTYDGNPIIIGKVYTPEFCAAQYQQDLIPAKDAVLRCTPGLFDNAYTAGSIIDFAFNVGGARYCASTMAKLFKAGNIRAGCAELVKWSYSKKKWLSGLFFRRQDETEKCLMGVA